MKATAILLLSSAAFVSANWGGGGGFGGFGGFGGIMPFGLGFGFPGFMGPWGFGGFGMPFIDPLGMMMFGGGGFGGGFDGGYGGGQQGGHYGGGQQGGQYGGGQQGGYGGGNQGGYGGMAPRSNQQGSQWDGAQPAQVATQRSLAGPSQKVNQTTVESQVFGALPANSSAVAESVPKPASNSTSA